ncbi:MAG: response regulator [Desulfohalobiaceae bacterium]|nr:response regulator [Desulfohalobiaceae bacterium]
MNEPELDFLVVDDEPDMCWALGHILVSRGYRGRSVFTGREALSLLKGQRAGLVFLDAKLPDFEGLDLAKLMLGIVPDIRIVLVSGYYFQDSQEIRQAGQDGVIAGFVSKPFKNDHILEAMRQSRSEQ